MLRFSISDDGKGFDLVELRAKPGARRGLGLISIRERAEFAGGEFRVETTPNGGTTVRVEIPLNR